MMNVFLRERGDFRAIGMCFAKGVEIFERRLSIFRFNGSLRYVANCERKKSYTEQIIGV